MPLHATRCLAFNQLHFLPKSTGLHNPDNDHYQFWVRCSHPIALTSHEPLFQRLDYVHQNPVRVGIVSQAEDYLYSSAIDYSGGKGSIDIIPTG